MWMGLDSAARWSCNSVPPARISELARPLCLGVARTGGCLLDSFGYLLCVGQNEHALVNVGIMECRTLSANNHTQ